MTAFRRRCLFVCVAFGCGPEVRPSEEGVSGTGGPSGSEGGESVSSGAASSSSTGVEACSVVMAEWVEVSDPASAEAYENVRSFEGGLRISEWPNETLGDSFPCIEEVGYLGLEVYDSDSLRSLEGMENLRSVVGAGIIIGGNSKLRTLRGLDGVEDVVYLEVFRNEELLDISLPAIQHLPRLTLGACIIEGTDALEFSNGLEDVGGFDSLQTIGRIIVSGQANLRSISAIQRIVEEGNARLIGPVTFQHNPMLPIGALDDIQASVSEAFFESCQNLNEDPESTCFCEVE